MDLELNECDKLDSYIIKQTIGQGTFSKVKLGTNKETKSKVAIKFLDKAKIIEKEDLERINREMKIIQQMNHSNIIKVYEMFQTPEYYLIIMEYCEGGELFDYIVEKQRLSEDEAAYFFYQLINGIEYIHSKGVVHRDLKPENLLLTTNNMLKIIDFGLSNYFEEELLSTPCGSPCYASPEMVSGSKYNGFFIDVWSTGIILYAMTCGYLPFEDEKNDLLFKKILQCKVYFPSHLSSRVKDLLMRIMNTNPEERITISGIKQHSFYLEGQRLFMKEQRQMSNVDRPYMPFPTENSSPILVRKPIQVLSTKPSSEANNTGNNNINERTQQTSTGTSANTKIIIKMPKKIYSKQTNKTEGNSKYPIRTFVDTQTPIMNGYGNSNLHNINLVFPSMKSQAKKKHKKINFSELLETQVYLETNNNYTHTHNSNSKTRPTAKRNVSTQRHKKALNSFKEKCPITINNAIINVNMIDPSMLYYNANGNNSSNRKRIKINDRASNRSNVNNPFSAKHFSMLPTSPNADSRLPRIIQGQGQSNNEQCLYNKSSMKKNVGIISDTNQNNLYIKHIKITNTNNHANINTIKLNRKPIKITSIKSSNASSNKELL